MRLSNLKALEGCGWEGLQVYAQDFTRNGDLSYLAVK